MTVQDVIARVDSLKPNRYSRPTKLEWLSRIEGQIYNEIVLTHESPMIPPPCIDKDTPPDYQLIAPAPYDEVYIFWLQCQIDYGNQEITKYNNDRTLFNNALMTLRDYWNRTFMPRERVHAFRFNDWIGRRHHPDHGPLGGGIG